MDLEGRRYGSVKGKRKLYGLDGFGGNMGVGKGTLQYRV